MENFNENNMNENSFAQSAQPARKTSKGVFIALALVVLLIIAAAVVIVLLINNKKKEDEKKERDSRKAAVVTYTEGMYKKDAFDDFMKVTMLDDVLKEYKKTDDYEDNKDIYKDMMEDLEDDIEITVSNIKKGNKLSDDELEAAEGYFDEQADDYNVDVDDIEVTEGYEYSFKFKITEDGATESSKEKVCAVKVKGDGWKVISLVAEDLCSLYGDEDNDDNDDNDGNDDNDDDFDYFRF